jgi:hypothetical protein
VLWKLKFVVVLVASKLKLLLAGLFKLPTLLSILVSFGVYWTAWGWRFAAGLLATMYVHEIGHVAALKRLGIRATAPMFVPGWGRSSGWEQYPADAHEDAQVGLAGRSGGSARRSSPGRRGSRPARRSGAPSPTRRRGSISSTCCPCGSSTAAAACERSRGPSEWRSP